jgi:hypothetical protein
MEQCPSKSFPIDSPEVIRSDKDGVLRSSCTMTCMGATVTGLWVLPDHGLNSDRLESPMTRNQPNLKSGVKSGEYVLTKP